MLLRASHARRSRADHGDFLSGLLRWRLRLDQPLVVIGVRADGQKVLLAIKSMGGESAEAWRTVLDDLIAPRPAATRVPHRSTGHRGHYQPHAVDLIRSLT
jgi:Transposase, Mutator family